jgi:hypothetical protein
LDGRKPGEQRDRRRITGAIAAAVVVSVFRVVGGVVSMNIMIEAS